MFKILPADPDFKKRFGPETAGVLVVGPDHSRPGEISPKTARELPIGWTAPAPHLTIPKLTDWSSRLIPLIGRDEALSDLIAWAEGEAPVSVRFLAGHPMSGKSRIPAEVCETLRARGWSAGFIEPTVSESFVLREAGSLLVVDEAHEIFSEVAELLQDIAVIPPGRRLRILVVAGESTEIWEDAIRRSLLGARVAPPLKLPRFAPDDLRKIYRATFERVLRLYGVPDLPGTDERIEAFAKVGYAPRIALLGAIGIVATADPEALARPLREAQVSGRTWVDDLAFERAWLAASISGTLSSKTVRMLARKGFLGPEVNEEFLDHSSWFDAELAAGEDAVAAPAPSCGVAGFVLAAAARHTEPAPHLLWVGLRESPRRGLAAIGALDRACNECLGIRTEPVLGLLTRAVTRRPKRCGRLERWLSHFGVSPSMYPLAALAGRIAIPHETNPSVLSGMWSRVSEALDRTGDHAGSIEAMRQAIAHLRSLARNDPAWRQPQLAVMLISMAEALPESDRGLAIGVLREAAEVLQDLAEENPAAWGERYATVLDQLSLWLERDGRRNEAIAATESSLPIRRRLVRRDGARSMSGEWLHLALDRLWDQLHDDDHELNAFVREPRSAEEERGFVYLQELVRLLRKRIPSKNGFDEKTLAFKLAELAEEYRVRDRREEAIAALREGIAVYGDDPDGAGQRVLVAWNEYLAEWETGEDLETEKEFRQEMEEEQAWLEEMRNADEGEDDGGGESGGESGRESGRESDGTDAAPGP